MASAPFPTSSVSCSGMGPLLCSALLCSSVLLELLSQESTAQMHRASGFPQMNLGGRKTLVAHPLKLSGFPPEGWLSSPAPQIHIIR